MTECPSCGSSNTKQVTDADVAGVAEFHCEDCGEYFTDEAESMGASDA